MMKKCYLVKNIRKSGYSETVEKLCEEFNLKRINGNNLQIETTTWNALVLRYLIYRNNKVHKEKVKLKRFRALEIIREDEMNIRLLQEEIDELKDKYKYMRL